MKQYTLKNSKLALTIADIGAKLLSLQWNGNELLYSKKDKYQEPKQGDVFDTRFAWGGDICFPSVAKTTLSVQKDTYHIADHGNFWYRQFQITDHTDEGITLQANDKFFELTFQIELQDNVLHRTYTIKNISQTDLPFIFADHLLLPIQEGYRPEEYITIPGVDQMTVEYSFEDKLGKKGQLVAWRKPRNRPYADKLFGTLKKNGQDDFTFSYQKKIEPSLVLNFYSPNLSYIGYWHTEGGWNNEYNLGLEFTNGLVDDVNTSSSITQILKAAEEVVFSSSLQVV